MRRVRGGWGGRGSAHGVSWYGVGLLHRRMRTCRTVVQQGRPPWDQSRRGVALMTPGQPPSRLTLLRFEYRIVHMVPAHRWPGALSCCLLRGMHRLGNPRQAASPICTATAASLLMRRRGNRAGTAEPQLAAGPAATSSSRPLLTPSAP